MPSNTPPAPSSSATPDGARWHDGLVNGEIVNLDSLTLHPRNARVGSLDTIKESLEQHGQFRAILVQRSTGHVIAGNHTLLAMRDLGWTEGVAAYLDVDDEEATRILLVDNRSSDEAGYDDQALIDVLKTLPSLEGTGFGEDDLLELRRLTGELGHDQSSFLDDLRQPNSTMGGDGQHHFQLLFPCTRDQRDTVNQTLNRIKTDQTLESSVEALVWLAGTYRPEGK